MFGPDPPARLTRGDFHEKMNNSECSKWLRNVGVKGSKEMEQTTRFVTKEDVFSWMEKELAKQIQPGLERMEWMLERLDHPERRLKFIHIAGTNGKGSTAAMIASVLREAEYPTGLFVSPFVIAWNERIQFDGQPISEESFVRWANEIKPLAEEMAQSGPGPLSPFEFWTLLAILYFAREALPWFVVWETGLGGRLDSTNVVWPLVSVITHVGMDHREWLGETLEEIAAEKAGIIKPGVPVVCGADREKAVEVLERTAKEKRSNFYLLNRDFSVEETKTSAEGSHFHFTNVYRELPGLFVPLVGKHQLKNAAVALMTLEVLRQGYATVIEPEHFAAGLAKTAWPGRLERLGERPLLVLDGAHNPDGARALAEAIRNHFDHDRLFVMMALMKEKDWKETAGPLMELADAAVAVEVKGLSRSLPADELGARLRKLAPDKPVHVFRTAEEGLAWMKRQAGENDLLVVTGSLFLVSEVRGLLLDGK
jgi:dihydrofolate synthase/folylpolyglutamate synthase